MSERQQTSDGGRKQVGAAHLLDAMQSLAIDHLFCNLGTDHAPLLEEIARRREAGEAAPRVILCPHENTAVHMAAGHALLTGHGQACVVHVDAGTANSAAGLHNLSRMRLPVLMLAGRAPYSSYDGRLGGRDSYVNFVQEPFDQASIVRPYVKWEYHLPSGIVAAEAVARACEQMHTAPQGPVYLTAAREILAAIETARPARRAVSLAPAWGDPAVIDLIADRLIGARHPLIVTSYLGRDHLAVPLLEELARTAGARVVESNPFTLNLPSRSPYHAGFDAAPLLAATDVGLLLDVDVPWLPNRGEPGRDSWWAQLDMDAEKRLFPLWDFPVNARVQGHTRQLLSQLLDAVRTRRDGGHRDRVSQRLKEIAAEGAARMKLDEHDAQQPTDAAGALRPQWVCAMVGKRLPQDAIVINEAVRNAPHVFRHVHRTPPGTRIGTVGGSLGFSAGLALGVQMANPQRTVMSIVGDGTFYFGNPQSTLAVAVSHGLPTITVVLDNGGWAAVKEATTRVYPNGAASRGASWYAGLGRFTDFSLVARAAGAVGHSARTPDEMAIGLDLCLAAAHNGTASVLHVHVADF